MLQRLCVGTQSTGLLCNSSAEPRIPVATDVAVLRNVTSLCKVCQKGTYPPRLDSVSVSCEGRCDSLDGNTMLPTSLINQLRV
jgi:hypothetical protein